MTKLELIAIGASTGVIVPKEMLERLNVGEGDALDATEMPDGGYRLTSFDPKFADRMEEADAIMRRYRNTLSLK